MPSATLPEEILDADDDKKIRALFVTGANPALAFPDQHKIVKALKSLELLVVIDPFMTATAELADYVIPPTMMYERSDVLLGPDFEFFVPEKFQQYIPVAVAPPEGSELIDDWRFYWELCKRLGVQLKYFEHDLNMATTPTSDELLELCMENSPISANELKSLPRGKIFDLPTDHVKPGRISPELTFQVMPQDVEHELNAASNQQETARFTLIPRRLRATLNTLGVTWPGCRNRQQTNPLWLHPNDADSLGIEGGDTVIVTSDYGSIRALVQIDNSTLEGVVAMTHCWGTLPENIEKQADMGVCTNLLTSIDEKFESINGMPWISSIPVNISKPQ